jgi:hypothetical protein
MSEPPLWGTQATGPRPPAQAGQPPQPGQDAPVPCQTPANQMHSLALDETRARQIFAEMLAQTTQLLTQPYATYTNQGGGQVVPPLTAPLVPTNPQWGGSG